MIEIKLTTSQMMQAALVGVMRQVTNIREGRVQLYGADGKSDWQQHIEGCMGEFALAMHLGVFWDGKLGDLSSGDVGAVEVRTAAEHSYRLIIHPKDPDDSRFYLVTGHNGTYKIQGWIHGRDAKVPAFWADPVGGRPAFFVPQNRLHSVDHA